MTVPAGHIEALATILGADVVRMRAAAAALETADQQFETRARGTSMGQTIPAGARIRVRCGTEGACRVGDVVVFMDGAELISHRVVYRGHSRSARAFVVTRGDGLVMPDRPVSMTSIVGRVTAVHRQEGWEIIEPSESASGGGFRRGVRAVALAAVIVTLELNVPAARRFGGLIALQMFQPSRRSWIGSALRGMRSLVSRRLRRG
jgi:hypothetical protein